MSLYRRLNEAGGDTGQDPRLSSGNGPAIDQMRHRIHGVLIEELGPILYDTRMGEDELRKRVHESLHAALAQERTPLSAADKATLIQDVSDDILGYGPIDKLLREEAVAIQVVTGEAPLVGHHLGADALRHESTCVAVALLHCLGECESDFFQSLRRSHRHHAHHLDPSCDDHVVGPGNHSLSCEMGRLLGRSTLAVDGRGRYRFRPPGAQHGVSAHVQSLSSDLHHASHDHVVDMGGVEVVAVGQGVQNLGGELNIRSTPGRGTEVHGKMSVGGPS